MPRIVFPCIVLILALTGCQKKDAEVLPPPAPPYTPIVLINSSFILGNEAKGILDTFYLQFNKPVHTVQLAMVNFPCDPDFKYTIDSNMVKFYNVLCARLGRDFQFHISVKDKEDKTYTDTVNFSYYTRKLPVEGTRSHFMISEDNKYCLVTTREPNRVYCFGLQDTSYKKVYQLPFQPGKIVTNPYNKKLYILNYLYYTDNTDKIYVMNPESGSIEKTITIALDQYDDSGKVINASDIEFGYNGYGVILTGSKILSRHRWRIIDSRLNDTIYAHPEWIKAYTGYGNHDFYEFVTCHVNFDGTTIYLAYPYAQPSMASLDCESATLEEVVFPNRNPNHYIKTHKKQDKYFIGSFMYQSIIGTNAPSYYSQFDNRWSEADFGYRDKEQNIMYMKNFEQGYEYWIVDYNKAAVLFRTNVSPTLTRPTCTTDGKWVIGESDNALCVFDTDWFYKYL